MALTLALLVVTFLATHLQVNAQGRSTRCQGREGREPNLSDDSCSTYLVCSDYRGRVRRCRSGQQYDYSSQTCRDDSSVGCRAQRQSRANTTAAPSTESTTTASPETTRASTLLTLLNALFPQPANPGLVGLQGNVPGAFPLGAQGFGGLPPLGIPPVNGLAGPLGAQGIAPQNPNQGLFLNLLGNNANAAAAAGIPGLGQFGGFQGGSNFNQIDNSLFGGVVEQDTGVIRPTGQRLPTVNNPSFQYFQPNVGQNIVRNAAPQGQIFNQIPQAAYNPAVANNFQQPYPLTPQYAYKNTPQNFVPNAGNNAFYQPSQMVPQNTPQLTEPFNSISQNSPNLPPSESFNPNSIPNLPPSVESSNPSPPNIMPNSPPQIETVPSDRSRETKEVGYPNNVPQISGILK